MAEATSHQKILNLSKKNHLFFSAAYPSVVEILRGRETEQTQLVFDDAGSIVNIDFGEGHLYNKPAAEFAAEQLAGDLAAPHRIVINPPKLNALDDACSNAMAVNLDSVAMDQLPNPPLDRVGTLIVIGIGLGLHLRELIAKTNPRHAILVEPITEFLQHSMSTVDWRKLWAQCAEAGTTIDIIAGGDPATLPQRLDTLMLGFGPTAIDGSYLYVHYRSHVTQAVAAKFLEITGTMAILKSYYADEKRMIENTYANFSNREFWFVEGNIRAPIGVPVFVVGAGPSLDECIDAIREWQDRAIVITAGSTLEVLLHHGIIPDFHVEKENTQLTAERLQHIHTRNAKLFDGDTFGPIKLVASTTVKPGVTELFDDKFLFMRSTLSSTEMFGAGHIAVNGTSPYSANTALTMAAIMGFHEVYMFGCDCGTKDPKQHHSGETACYTLDSYPNLDIDFPLRAIGNFGGEILTNHYFWMSRSIHEQVIAAAGLTVRNCSDGVLISGAQPLRPGDLVLTNPPIDKGAAIETVKSRSTQYMPGAFFSGQNLPGLIEDWSEFAAAFRSFLDAHLKSTDDLYQFDRRLNEFLDRAARKYSGVARMVRGSAQAMMPIATYYLNRSPDSAASARLMEAFRTTFLAEVERILVDGSQVMANLDSAPGRALRQTG